MCTGIRCEGSGHVSKCSVWSLQEQPAQRGARSGWLGPGTAARRSQGKGDKSRYVHRELRPVGSPSRRDFRVKIQGVKENKKDKLVRSKV